MQELETLSKADQIKWFERILKDPLEFMKYVYTKDEVDKNTPIKRFPVDLEYIKFYVRLWQRKNLLAIPKSRRMKMSWTNLVLYTHDGGFNIGRHHAFVSKKEEDADVLVQKAKFILENLKGIPPDLIPRMEYKYCLLRFPELDSKIEAFPSGADQLRQFTFSGVLGDEMAFWPDAQKMYAATFPTIEGGGRMTLISSPAPSFFKKIVFDTIDSDGSIVNTEETTSRKILYPMPGVEIWTNPKNRFTIFQLHYSADPSKRSKQFKEIAKSSMPYRDYMMEYELSWDSWEGMPVFPDWDETHHAAKEKIAPIAGLPLLRGWDFGLTPACLIAQLQDNKLVVIKEFTAVNMGAKRFSKMVLDSCALDFPRWSDRKKHWRDFIDPSGTFRKDTDESTCAMILGEQGLNTIPGEITWESRRQSVEHYLTKFDKEGSCLKVNVADCPVLARGFRGGYLYPEKAVEIEPDRIRPLKNEYSHIHDAFQMITSRLITIKHSNGIPVPTPNYGWMHERGER